MTDRASGIEDWVVPAVLVGLALGLLMVVGIALAVSAEARSDAPVLIQELDTYTACLVGYGADVPRLEIGRDGGFAITVPGSLVDGEVDGAAWRHAMDECATVAPDPFGPLVGSLWLNRFDIVDDMDATIDADTFRFDGDEGGSPRHRSGPGPWMQPPDELLRRCDRLEDGGFGAEGLRGDRLRRLCEDLDR